MEGGQLHGAPGVSCWVKMISTYPDKDDASTHVSTDCVKTHGDGKMQFGSSGFKHHFPIERPLRNRPEREGKFEKKLARRKVLMFELWEKGGWFGKDSCKAHASWPSDPQSTDPQNFGALMRRSEVRNTSHCRACEYLSARMVTLSVWHHTPWSPPGTSPTDVDGK